MHKVCVVTSGRADYYLLRPLMSRLQAHPAFDLRVAVTGSHLSEEQGNTVAHIEADGFPIDARLEILSGDDSRTGESIALANAVLRFDEYFKSARPAMAVVLGDRFEMLGVASAACIQGVPLAHIHGGEITLGAIDDSIRHAITKLSYLHFTSCEEYRTRVIQMGESPDRVFNVGSLGVENILANPLMSASELSDDLGIDLCGPFALVTLHPETRGAQDPRSDALAVVEALDAFPGLSVVITKANVDAGGVAINEVFAEAVQTRANWRLFANLGMKRYLSAMAHASFMLGNTSSGVIEAPALGVPVVNVGTRQDGRVRCSNVIDCALEGDAMVRAAERAMTPQFKEEARGAKGMFGDGSTSTRIAEVLKCFLDKGIDLKKPFYDLMD